MSHRVLASSWPRSEQLLESPPSATPQHMGPYARLPQGSLDDMEEESESWVDPMSGRVRSRWRRIGLKMLESGHAQGFIGVLTSANAVVFGLETEWPEAARWDLFENAFLAMFTAEISVRMVLLGFDEFFDAHTSDFAWNMLDLSVVTLGVFDFLLDLVVDGTIGHFATIFRMLRLLRIFRLFRSARSLKQLYLLAYGFGEAARAIFWVGLFMNFTLYACALIIVRTFGHPDPEDEHEAFLKENFGSVRVAMLSLFELVASPDLPRYQEQKGLLWAHPGLLCFLCSFIVFGSFGLLALLNGLISESIVEKNELRREEAHEEKELSQEMMAESCGMLFDRSFMASSVSLEEVRSVLPRLDEVLAEFHVHLSERDLEAISASMACDRAGDRGIDRLAFQRAVVFRAAGIRPLSRKAMPWNLAWCKYKLERLLHSVDKLVDLQIDAVKGVNSEVAQALLSRLDALEQRVAQGYREQRDASERMQRRQAAESSSKCEFIEKLQSLDNEIALTFAEHQEVMEKIRKQQNRGLHNIQSILQQELAAISGKIFGLRGDTPGHMGGTPAEGGPAAPVASDHRAGEAEAAGVAASHSDPAGDPGGDGAGDASGGAGGGGAPVAREGVRLTGRASLACSGAADAAAGADGGSLAVAGPEPGGGACRKETYGGGCRTDKDGACLGSAPSGPAPVDPQPPAPAARDAVNGARVDGAAASGEVGVAEAKVAAPADTERAAS